MRVTVGEMALRSLPCVRRWGNGVRAAVCDIGRSPALSEFRYHAQPVPQVRSTTGLTERSLTIVNTVPLWLRETIV